MAITLNVIPKHMKLNYGGKNKDLVEAKREAPVNDKTSQ